MIGRWTTLLAALAETQGYRPSVTDEAVLSAVIRRLVGATDGYTALRPLTIPDVARALADPTDDLITAGRFAGRREWLDHTRSITDALTNLSSARWPGCSTPPPTSTSTGTPRSSRWTCRCCAPAATRRSPSR